MPMSIDAEKKGYERMYLKYFIEDYGIQGQLIDDERPDFKFINSDGTIIGIEVTRAFQPKPDNSKYYPSQIESQFNLITELTKQYFLEKYKIPLTVIITFDKEIICSKKETITLSMNLSNLIFNYIKTKDLSSDFIIPIHNDENIPNGIYYIGIVYNPDVLKTTWNGGRAQFLPKLNIEQICKMIHKKEQKISFYKVKYDNLWLLILFATFEQSTSFTDNYKILNHKFETKFNNVFLYKFFERTYLKLK